MLLFLGAGVAAMMGHYLSYDAQVQTRALQQVSVLTKVPSASLSVAWYEPRVRLYQKAQNPAYPQLQPIDRMDFVYAE
jgi:hypothetical protein